MSHEDDTARRIAYPGRPVSVTDWADLRSSARGQHDADRVRRALALATYAEHKLEMSCFNREDAEQIERRLTKEERLRVVFSYPGSDVIVERVPMAPAVAALCADWWAERFMIDDKREAFRTALRQRLETGDIHRKDQYGQGSSIIRLEVDYDPRGTLLEVIQSLGIECSGCMFSADGILPRKRRMRIGRADGSIEVQDGRGHVDWIVRPPEDTEV